MINKYDIMIKYIVETCFIICLFSSLNITAQGLLLDVEISEDHDKIQRSRADRVPKIASLKEYTPYVMMQQNSTCVAYSVATARTILFARNNDIKSKDTITALFYSPHWVYYLNKDQYDTSCSQGLNLDKTLKHILGNGIPRMAYVEYPLYYPFTEDVLCGQYPPSINDDIKDAESQMVDEVYLLENLEDVKIAISRGMPVVFGMGIPNTFENVFGQDVWLPDETTKAIDRYGHAMVIVGYNDYKYGGAVQIMNSWGEDWGNNGFIWIKYDDLLDYITKYVYALDKKKEIKFGGLPSILENETIENVLNRDELNETINRFSNVTELVSKLNLSKE